MPLRSMPTELTGDILGRESAVRSHSPDGNPILWASRQTYSVLWPPLGFFPFYNIDNGDEYGLYWPVGREDQPPLVAFTNHDVGSLIPINSSIEGLLCSRLAIRNEPDDDEDFDDEEFDDEDSLADDEEQRDPVIEFCQEWFQREAGRVAECQITREVAATDFERLLLSDAESPFLLCATADLQVAANRLDVAEQNYRQAISQLPEYAAAHFGLASLLRRQQRAEEATVHLRAALLGPSSLAGRAFWSNVALPGNSRNDWLRKSLAWLQGTKQLHPSLTDDSFVRVIGQLKLQSGLSNNQDVDILQAVVEEYAAKGAFAEAAQVWQRIGELAAAETTSFRERYGLKPASFGLRWAELLELAGNTRRAALMRNIVSRLEKPDGLYL